ncbi:unnamed protein product, partial [Prorocentrum cordatum]
KKSGFPRVATERGTRSRSPRWPRGAGTRSAACGRRRWRRWGRCAAGGRSPRSPRQAAVRCVSKVARRGNEAAAAVLGVLCRDRDQLVRKAAVEVLGQVAPRGDRQAISVVVDCLVDDPFQGVRRAAVDTLGMIGEKGDQQVISKAGRRLENKNDEFIMSVAAALEQLRGL